MKIWSYIILIFFFTSLSVAAKAGADFKQTFVDDILKHTDTMIIITNDLDKNMDKANAQLDQALRKYYTATKVIFVNRKLSEMVKDKKGDAVCFGILRPDVANIAHQYPFYDERNLTIGFIQQKKGRLFTHTSHPTTVLFKNFDALDVIWAVRLLNQEVSEMAKGQYDDKTRVTTNSSVIFYRLIKNNIGKLKDKVLLINKALLDPKLTEEKIKAVYPYKFKIVDYQEIAKAVINNEPGYAYTQQVCLNGGIHVIDTEKGDLLSYGNSDNVFEVTLKSFVSHSQKYP